MNNKNDKYYVTMNTQELVNHVDANIENVDEYFFIIFGEYDESIVLFKHIMIESFADKCTLHYPHIIGLICYDSGCEEECYLYILYLDKEYSYDDVYHKHNFNKNGNINKCLKKTKLYDILGWNDKYILILKFFGKDFIL